MKAFILAAGVSRRLYPHTYNTPKCLLKVDGKPIIHYQLESLKSIGISDITLVVGYQREILINHLKENFPHFNYNFVINHIFDVVPQSTLRGNASIPISAAVQSCI